MKSQVVVVAAICEFLGACLLGASVTSTIKCVASDVLDAAPSHDPRCGFPAGAHPSNTPSIGHQLLQFGPTTCDFVCLAAA
jgi:hypothetical protein